MPKNQIALNKDFSLEHETFFGKGYVHLDLNNIINIKFEHQEASVPQVSLLLTEEVFEKLVEAYSSYSKRTKAEARLLKKHQKPKSKSRRKSK